MATETHEANTRSTGSKKKIYPRINPPPQIMGSTRTTKARKSSLRKSSWKDVMSAHSSVTSQTMTSVTDMSSAYSMSHSSPGSHDGKPKVVVQMQNMDSQLRGSLQFDPKDEPVIPEDSDLPRLDSGTKNNKAERNAFDESLQFSGERQSRPLDSSNRREDTLQRWDSCNNSRRSLKNGGSSSRKSLNSSVGVSTPSRPSVGGDVGGRDCAASYPQRRLTLEEEQEEVQLEHQLDRHSEMNDGDDDSNDDSNRTDDDKLSPLVDPVSARLQTINDRNRNPTSSQQSVGTSSFSASYGSMSLGGDASLSSSDTFCNSPIEKEKNIVSTSPRKPDLQAQPQKRILKPSINPIEWNRPKFGAAEEEFYRDPMMETDSESQASACLSRVSSSPAESFSSKHSASSWNESLKSFSGRGDKKLATRRESGVSVDSGDVTIDTYSDGGSASVGRDYPSVSIHSKPRDSQHMRNSVGEDSKGKVSSETTGLSVVENSWGIFPGHSAGVFSVTTDGAEKKSTGTRNADVTINTPHSYSSWTSSNEWSAPRQASEHWASQSWSQRHGDVAEWTSGDDSSSSGDLDEDASEGQESNVSPLPAKKMKAGRPRSAFDKNAPWYCGEDGEGLDDVESMNSDSSSILSNLKKPKSVKKPPAMTMGEPPASDASMSFTDLAKPLSMSFTDLGAICDQGKGEEVTPAVAPPESSMSLGGLIDAESGVLSATKAKQLASSGFQSGPLPADTGMKSSKSVSANSMLVAPLGQDEESQDNPEFDPGQEDMSVHRKWSEEILDKLKIFEKPWCRRALFVCLAAFLIFDVVLVIMLFTK